MQHCMAIRAYRPEIFLGVEDVGLTDLCQGREVVDVDEAGAQFGAVGFSKVEVAHHTAGAPAGNAEGARGGVSLVGVDDDGALGAFDKAFGYGDFLGQRGGRRAITVGREDPADFDGRAVFHLSGLAGSGVGEGVAII